MQNTRIKKPRQVIEQMKSTLVIAAALSISFLTATIWIGTQLIGQNIVVFSIYLLHIFLTLCP